MLLICSLFFAASLAVSRVTVEAQSNYEPYSFTTFAGVTPGSTDGTGNTARFEFPNGVAVDSTGNAYVADTNNSTIRKITPSGVVSTLAGLAGSSGSTDGTGNTARFSQPEGVAVDSAGNVYVADTGNFTIRKISASGVVSTLAGIAGSFGSADGTGSAARFAVPQGIAVDTAGNVYVADTFNNTVRKITPAGVVSTFAGLAGSTGSADGTGSVARFAGPSGVAVDSAGNVYVADRNNHTIRKITTSGVVSTLAGLAGSAGSADGTGSAARFNQPSSVAVDNASNLYVADSSNEKIRKITSAGAVSTFAGAGSTGSADGTGIAARFNVPAGVAVDSAGNVYVADTANHTIRKITASGAVTTLAGLASPGSADGTGSAARFDSPRGVGVDSAGNVYVADTGNHTVRKITSARVVGTLAGLARNAGSADGTGSAARFTFPDGVGVDSAGNVYVADTSNHTIRKITTSGVVSTLAGLASSFGSADGAGSAARFNFPEGVAVDSAGNVYVADNLNRTIRKITPSGLVSTLAGLAGSAGSADGTGSAARFNSPSGVAVDSSGNVYVADTSNHTIRKITTSAVVSTLAGLAGSFGSADGTGSAARFTSPQGVAVDSAGNVYVADTGNGTIRKITPSGSVSTLAGLAGSIGGSTDGTGSAARFNQPKGVAVDSAGNVYVAVEQGNAVLVGVKVLQPVITSPLQATGTAGQPFTYQITATNNPTSYDGVGLPTGLNVNSSTGLISGTLSVAGSFDVTISASNGGGTGSATLRLTISPAGPLPMITSPLTAIVIVNQKFVYQFETTNATSLAVTNLPPGLVFDPTLSAIVGNPTASGTFQIDLSASNSAGAAHATLTLTVQPPPPSGPVIASSTAATGRVGQPFRFQVYTTGGTAAARVNASGLPQGLSIDPVSGLISGTPTAAGSSAVTLTVTDGSFTANSTLQLTFTADPALAVIIGSDTVLLTPGQATTYATTAPSSAGPSDPTIFTLIGTLPPGLNFSATTGVISGTYTGLLQKNSRRSPMKPDLAGGALLGSVQLFGTNSHGTSTFQLLFLAGPSGAVNISTRLLVGTGENVLIGGFIITGDAPKVVIARAIGPSTGVPGALQDPVLELHDSAGHVVVNDNWKDTQKDLIVASTVPPLDDRESAIVIGLDPGNYTAIVSGKDGGTGIALAEVYDLGTASLATSASSKLANISTRGFVLTGNNVMIGGFIVQRTNTKVIVRAIGPSLSQSGVQGTLQDPVLELRDASGSLIVSNDDWRSTQEQQIIDTTVPPKDDRESAIVATLIPGNYTAIVHGKNNATGVGLVEVYGLQ